MTDAPSPTQRELASWVESTFGKNVTQGTIFNTLKRSAELLAASGTANLSGKSHKAVNYPMMENELLEWFQTYQGEVAMRGGAAQVHRSVLPSTTLPGCLPI